MGEQNALSEEEIRAKLIRDARYQVEFDALPVHIKSVGPKGFSASLRKGGPGSAEAVLCAFYNGWLGYYAKAEGLSVSRNYEQDEFNVQFFGIDPFEVVQMNMPKQGIYVPLCHRIYLVYSSQSQDSFCRYFTVEEDIDGAHPFLCEVSCADRRHTNYGLAPAYTEELTRILEITKESYSGK